MASTPFPTCPQCRLPLHAADEPVFGGTVFAEGAHDCARARKILNEANRGALLFAARREFVHARLINPGVTHQAWIEILTEATTTHDLVHRLLVYDQETGAPQGVEIVMVISTREDFTPDMRELQRDLLKQIRAALG